MAGLFERIHEQLGGGSWLIGRVTGSEYAKARCLPRSHRPDLSARTLVRPARCGRLRHRARRAGQDRLGTVRYRRRPDRRGADRTGLRRASGGAAPDGVSYIFAGERELDLGLALEILNRELGIERLLLEGGGGSNGSFLRAGLIDEISLAICPAVDGAKGAPSIFDSRDGRCRRRGAAPLDDAGEQRGAGGRRGLAPLSAAERLTLGKATTRGRPSFSRSAIVRPADDKQQSRRGPSRGEGAADDHLPEPATPQWHLRFPLRLGQRGDRE